MNNLDPGEPSPEFVIVAASWSTFEGENKIRYVVYIIMSCIMRS